MIKIIARTSLLAATLVGCGGSQPASQTPDTTPDAVEPSTYVLVIEAAKVTFPAAEDGSDGGHSIEVMATGEAFTDGAQVGTLKPDGSVLSGEQEVIAKITKDGSLTFPGQEEVMLISEDGAITTRGRTIALFQEDGSFRIPQNGRLAAYEGPASARRAIVVVFATAMTIQGPGGRGEDAPQPTVDSPEATVEVPSE